MKMIMAVVAGSDEREVKKNLMKEGFSVTKLSSSGGFLKSNTATLITVVPAERVQLALDTLKKTTKAHHFHSGHMTPESKSYYNVAPGGQDFVIGGATVFVLDVEKFEKY